MSRPTGVTAVTGVKGVKGWPGWLLLGAVVVALLSFGASRDDGPSTPGERVDAIAKQLACPTCDGESVFESRSPVSINIRSAIRDLVDEGGYTDDEIIASVSAGFADDITLLPKADGVDALVWILPVVAFVCAGAGLVVAFRRWGRDGATDGEPTDDDRALVAAALAEDGGGNGAGDDR